MGLVIRFEFLALFLFFLLMFINYEADHHIHLHSSIDAPADIGVDDHSAAKRLPLATPAILKYGGIVLATDKPSIQIWEQPNPRNTAKYVPQMRAEISLESTARVSPDRRAIEISSGIDNHQDELICVVTRSLAVLVFKNEHLLWESHLPVFLADGSEAIEMTCQVLPFPIHKGDVGSVFVVGRFENNEHNYHHLDSFMFDSETGRLRWKHQKGDFHEGQHTDGPISQFDLADAHDGEQDWRLYSKSLFQYLPLRFTRSNDLAVEVGRLSRGEITEGIANVIIIKSEEGLEALHIYSGRMVTRIPLTTHMLHADVDGDEVIEHVFLTASKYGQSKETRVVCSGDIPPIIEKWDIDLADTYDEIKDAGIVYSTTPIMWADEEMVVTVLNSGRVTAIDWTGEIVWSTLIGTTSTSVVHTFNNDRLIIATESGSESSVYVLSKKGKLLGTHNTNRPIIALESIENTNYIIASGLDHFELLFMEDNKMDSMVSLIFLFFTFVVGLSIVS
ncbi:hypothetical protein PCE1_001447 [Barthelona sp. PCE]